MTSSTWRLSFRSISAIMRSTAGVATFSNSPGWPPRKSERKASMPFTVGLKPSLVFSTLVSLAISSMSEASSAVVSTFAASGWPCVFSSAMVPPSGLRARRAGTFPDGVQDLLGVFLLLGLLLQPLPEVLEVAQRSLQGDQRLPELEELLQLRIALHDRLGAEVLHALDVVLEGLHLVLLAAERVLHLEVHTHLHLREDIVEGVLVDGDRLPLLHGRLHLPPGEVRSEEELQGELFLLRHVGVRLRSEEHTSELQSRLHLV